MSIYATIAGVEHHEPCGAPWIYRGSHILPAEDDPRGGEIGLALIPSHITRDGRDDQPEDGRPYPWLRLNLLCEDDGAVLINPEQARYLAEQLAMWADSTEPSRAVERHTVDTISSDALDALYSRIATLEHVAAGNKRHVQLIVPDLERAEAAIARVREMHRRRTERHGSGCVQCGIVWPCPTFRALDGQEG